MIFYQGLCVSTGVFPPEFHVCGVCLQSLWVRLQLFPHRRLMNTDKQRRRNGIFKRSPQASSRNQFITGRRLRSGAKLLTATQDAACAANRGRGWRLMARWSSVMTKLLGGFVMLLEELVVESDRTVTRPHAEDVWGRCGVDRTNKQQL